MSLSPSPARTPMALRLGSLIAVTLLMLAAAVPAGAEPSSTGIARGGRALLPVVTAAKASSDVKAAASLLADYLKRISGADFTVTDGDGSSGIAVGRESDFPSLKVFDQAGIWHREDYLLRSHRQGLYLVGTTDMAVRHAVWDFLHRLGYRQYFPGPVWEVIPRQADLSIAVDSLQSPSYNARRFPYGYGLWGYNNESCRQWQERNRMGNGIQLSTGHAYGAIIKANKEAFQAHPEYLALVRGQRQGNKFCISNAELRALVSAYAVNHFRKNPQADSISMEPSDGGGWCECPDCAKMGSVSDRVVLLANDVAEAINKIGLGDKYVGIYAYNEHSLPPSVRVHPRVIVSIATAFVKGGLGMKDLLKGWGKDGTILGIREYYSTHAWDKDLPGAASVANSAYLKRTIADFHSQGARLMTSDGGDNWGGYGLGYWLAARMLWDVKEAARIEELKEDFLGKSFGPAQKTMREFYRLIDGANRPLISEDLIGRMYETLQTARLQAAKETAVLARIDSLIKYTRYVELYREYASAEGAKRQAAFEALIRYGYRIRESMVIHSKALYRDLPTRDSSVKLPPEAAWSVPEGKNPWKDSTPLSDNELDDILHNGIANNELFDFTPVAFSQELVPAASLKLPPVPKGVISFSNRGLQSAYTWVDKAPHAIELKVTGGLIAHYRNRGNIRFSLFSPQEATLEAVATDNSTPPDGKEYTVKLTTPYSGLHRLEWTDGNDMTQVLWPEGSCLTLLSSMEQAPRLTGRWSLCFYVPGGTKTVAGFAGGNKGLLLDADGRKVFDFAGMEGSGYFSVPVAGGQDGRLWRFSQCSGVRRLLTVPPYLARSADELLLPREVVEGELAAGRAPTAR